MSALKVAILAGGRSSRMGTDKRFLKIDGVTLLERAIALGEQLGEVLICGDVPGYKCLPDEVAHQGPISGLMSVARNVKEPGWVLVLPVDMPLLTKSVLMELVTNAELPGVYFAGREMPFLFWCDAAAVQVLGSLKRWSIRAFLTELGAKQIALSSENESVFVNLNQPQDLEALDEYSSGR